jgi:hypothetical protein
VASAHFLGLSVVNSYLLVTSKNPGQERVSLKCLCQGSSESKNKK